MKAYLSFSYAKYPEPHHSKKRPSSRKWFTHIDSQINKLLSEASITRVSGRSSFGRVDYYSQAVKHRVDNYQRLHTPSKLLHKRIHLSLDHLMMLTDTLILGDFNAHHSPWYSSTTNSRGTMLESMMSGSNFGILNWDSPTRLLISINLHQLEDEDEPMLRPSTNPH